MANALQYLDDVLSPEVRSLLSDQMGRRRAAQETLLAGAAGPATGPLVGEPPAPAQGYAPPSGLKAWFDRRLAEAHPGWKIDQTLRDNKVGMAGRLWGALNPEYAARKLREFSPAAPSNPQPGPIAPPVPTPQPAILQRGPYIPDPYANRYEA